MVLKGNFNLFTAVSLKRTNWRQVQWFYCCCCLASADLRGDGAGLVTADVLAGQ